MIGEYTLTPPQVDHTNNDPLGMQRSTSTVHLPITGTRPATPLLSANHRMCLTLLFACTTVLSGQSFAAGLEMQALFTKDLSSSSLILASCACLSFRLSSMICSAGGLRLPSIVCSLVWLHCSFTPTQICYLKSAALQSAASACLSLGWSTACQHERAPFSGEVKPICSFA